MTLPYNNLDISFTNAIDGIDVDRLSIPSSPTLTSRERRGSSKTGGSRGGGEVGSGARAGGNGLGSLADELAALGFDDDEDEYEEDQDGDEEEEEQQQEEEEQEQEGEEEEEEKEEAGGGGQGDDGEEEERGVEGGEDQGVVGEEEEEEERQEVRELLIGFSEVVTSRRRSSTPTSNQTISSHSRTKSKASSLSSHKAKRRSSYCRESEEDSMMEELEGGVTTALQEKLDQIEQLAVESRRMKFVRSAWTEDSGGGGGMAENGFNSGSSNESNAHGLSLPRILQDDEEPDDVIPRLLEGLQKLQPQTTMETSASRLITAHAALSNHMFYETRSLRGLCLGLYSVPPPETTDLLTGLGDLIPRPPLHPLEELSSIRLLTSQLVAQLAFLSDTLHMARQSSIAANRRLRVAKEACAEWKEELEMAERGRRWIEEGDWVSRCSKREAAGVCVEVMEGFEKACLGAEQRMKAITTV